MSVILPCQLGAEVPVSERVSWSCVSYCLGKNTRNRSVLNGSKSIGVPRPMCRESTMACPRVHSGPCLSDPIIWIDLWINISGLVGIYIYKDFQLALVSMEQDRIQFPCTTNIIAGSDSHIPPSLVRRFYFFSGLKFRFPWALLFFGLFFLFLFLPYIPPVVAFASHPL